MLTVIMECQNQEQEIVQSLSSLVSGAVQGLVADVILLDHGSSDGTAAVADAVGCRHLETFDLVEVLSSTRCDWLLVLEPGSRIMPSSWNEEIPEHIRLNLGAARFRPSMYHRKAIWRRIFARPNPLELGMLIHRDDALRAAKIGLNLREIARTTKKRNLIAQIAPAWALPSSASGSAAL